MTHEYMMNTLTLVVTELVRWSVIVLMIYLSVWQYCSIVGYTLFVSYSSTPSASLLEAQFWGVFTAIIVGITLVVYLPWRYLAIKYQHKHHITMDERWRPAIVFYILFAATPCFTLILVAYKMATVTQSIMDPTSVTILQMVVMGLVITEWAVKIQQEKFTYQLVTVMALDFFFAYDVIAFVMMSVDTRVFLSGWVYPCFVFAVVAMCKYIPTQPTGLMERGSSMGHLVCILTSMFCNDIPFVVIRLATMIIFSTFLISDMIFLMKNFFVLIFSCIQLGFIFNSLKHHELITKEAEWTSKNASMPPPSATVDGVTDVDGRSSRWTVVRERMIGDKREFRKGPDDVWNKVNEPVASNRVTSVDTKESDKNERGKTDGTMAVEGSQMDIEEFDNEAYTP